MCVKGFPKDVEGCLNTNNLKPAFRALKKPRLKFVSQASTTRTADGQKVFDADGHRAH